MARDGRFNSFTSYVIIKSLKYLKAQKTSQAGALVVGDTHTGT